MLRKEPERQQSFYCALYEKIPENHILKLVSKAVDFSFINEFLEGSYCKNFGRPAKEPEIRSLLKLISWKGAVPKNWIKEFRQVGVELE